MVVTVDGITAFVAVSLFRHLVIVVFVESAYSYCASTTVSSQMESSRGKGVERFGVCVAWAGVLAGVVVSVV